MDWQPMSIKPSRPMGVFFWVPESRFDDMAIGQDYSIEVGFWDGGGFRLQGTSHDLDERIDLGLGHYPTHWAPLPEPPTA